ncbi:putative 2b protein [Peanut virus C]|nr:putative 2b protein [Peanut virus C]
MFIPILLLTLILGVSADLMVPKLDPQEMEPPVPPSVSQKLPVKEDPEVKLAPGESVSVSAGENPTVQIPVESRLEEKSPPGREGSRCIDCAVAHLPETLFSVKVPKLNIDFDVTELPSSKLIFASLAEKVKQLPFVKTMSIPSGIQRLQLRSLGEVEVHVTIPKFGWVQTLKLSDVISGFDIPKLPTITPKVESCVGECQDH